MLVAAHGGAGQLGAGMMCFAGGESLRDVGGAWAFLVPVGVARADGPPVFGVSHLCWGVQLFATVRPRYATDRPAAGSGTCRCPLLAVRWAQPSDAWPCNRDGADVRMNVNGSNPHHARTRVVTCLITCRRDVTQSLACCNSVSRPQRLPIRVVPVSLTPDP